MGNQVSTPSPAAAPAAVATPTTTTETSKPKPCCVCKEEKAKRDECMLMSRAPNPEEDCKSTILQYKACMEGFGFKV